MITKILVCGIALGLLAALSALTDRGGRQQAEPGCDSAGGGCQHQAAAPRVSTERFFAILAMR